MNLGRLCDSLLSSFQGIPRPLTFLLLTVLLTVLLTLPAPSATFPHALTIHGAEWTIEIIKKPIVADGEKFSGMTLCFQRRIQILRDDDAEMATTLLHEIMHAVTCEGNALHNERYGDNTTLPQQEEHPAINYASAQLAAVMLNNPDLCDWMRHVAYQRDMERRAHQPIKGLVVEEPRR